MLDSNLNRLFLITLRCLPVVGPQMPLIRNLEALESHNYRRRTLEQSISSCDGFILTLLARDGT